MNVDTLTIDMLGAQGDGVARTAGGPVYVPFTLPGETVSVRREKARGELVAVETAAAERVKPPCPHFGPEGRGGACGGCSLQHMALPAYQDWKRALVVRALAAQGLTTEVAPLFACAPGARRRMVMTARRTEKGGIVGFNEAGSHHIVPLETCHIGDPRILTALDGVRRLADPLAPRSKPFRLTVLASDTGLDVAFDGVGRVSEKQRQAAVRAALDEDAIARVTADGEMLIEKCKPTLAFGPAIVTPPPGGFVQASAAAEAHMAGLVTAHLSGCRRVADLFSGSGTFALRLARQMTVHAVEADAKALAALDAAFRHIAGTKSITVERRDLDRRPMMAAELKPFDGLVFDPPRAGAEAQAREIAGAGIRRVAAVSCNPATLARDLRILVDGGLRIEAVHPVDQFLWSPHVEAVALLSR